MTSASSLARLLCGVLLAVAWPGPDAAAQPADPTPAEAAAPADPGRPVRRAGLEEIVVLGADSAAAADYAAGDSVTGFGAEDLAAIGAEDIADIASFTPNLEIVTSGATTPTFFIRGVGLNDFNPTATGAVAIYTDDVAINAPALQLGLLFDVESVNVLRGPQGTGLGRNASAGAIKLYSRKPTGQFGGFLRTDIGNFGAQDYEGAVEAPIFRDLLSGRLAFRLSKRDGTMRNRCAGAAAFDERDVYPGGIGNLPVEAPWSICGEPVTTIGAVSPIPVGLAKYVNDTDVWAARGTLLFQPNLDMQFLLNGHGSKRDELTRLGQSIGTGGNFCIDGDICTAPFAGVPRDERGRASGGVLGGLNNGTSAGADYRSPEVFARLVELAPCFADGFGCALSPREDREAANRAKIQLANELADELDPEPWVGDFNFTGPTRNETRGGFLKGDIFLPGEIQLLTTTGYDAYERNVFIDLDFSPETLFHIFTEDEGWQFYQDAAFKGGLVSVPVEWEVGGWFLHEDLDVQVINDFGELAGVGVAAREYSQKLDSAAGYAWASIDLRDDLTLDGGARLNWERKQLDMRIRPAVPPDRFESPEDSWIAPTGTVRLTYRFREDTQVFWKYTRGWKPGTFNATASQFTGVTQAEPENLDSFETGIQGAWLDSRFMLDAAFFYYAYEDYQIFTATQFLGGNPEFVILNASDAEVYGVEADAVVRPWDGAFVNVRFSWLESQFLDFVKRDQFLASSGGQDLVTFRESQYSGNPLLNSPRFKVSLTAEQRISLGRFGSLTPRYDAVWTDTTYYDPTRGAGLGNLEGEQFLPSNTIAQRPYWLHNLRLGWQAPGATAIEIAGWVRNLTNQVYKSFAFDGSSFRRTTIYFVGDPRTYGVSASITF